jgi:hypothetical protein
MLAVDSKQFKETQGNPPLVIYSCYNRLMYLTYTTDVLRELVSSNEWKIRAAEGFALFPGSDHIETVVVFDRTKSALNSYQRKLNAEEAS